MVEFILIVLSFFIIYLLNKYRKKIGKKTQLLDKPDKIRKFHKKSIPLLGGIMIFSSYILINFYSIFFQEFKKTSLIICSVVWTMSRQCPKEISSRKFLYTFQFKHEKRRNHNSSRIKSPKP